MSKEDQEHIMETAREVQKLVVPLKTLEENKQSICSQFSGDKYIDCETLMNEYFNEFVKNAKTGKSETALPKINPTKVFARRVARNTPPEEILSSHGHHH
jgi:hypothetical protein